MPVHPIARQLRRIARPELADALFWWNHIQNTGGKSGNLHAWTNGGTGQLAASVTTPARTHYDPRLGQVVTVPANRLGFGAPQMPARTNLAGTTRALDGADWTAARATVSTNADTDPEGNTTADRLVESTDTGTHYIFQAVTLTAANYTVSVRVPVDLAGTRLLRILDFTTGEYGVFNVSDGSLSSSSGLEGYHVIREGDWWRFAITYTGTAASHNIGLALNTVVGGLTSYTGDGSTYLTLTNFQIELGDFPGPTIHNDGSSSEARAADATRWIWDGFAGASARGTLLTVFEPPYGASNPPGGFPGIIGLNDGDSSNDYITNYISSSTGRVASKVRESSTNIADGNTSGMEISGAAQCLLISWEAGGDLLTYIDADLKLTQDISAYSGIDFDQLELNGENSSRTRSGINYLHVALWPYAVTAEQAKALTFDPNIWKYPH